MIRRLAAQFLEVFPASIECEMLLWSDLLHMYLHKDRAYHSIELLDYLIKKADEHCSNIGFDTYKWDSNLNFIKAAIFYQYSVLESPGPAIPASTMRHKFLLSALEIYSMFYGLTEENKELWINTLVDLTVSDPETLENPDIKILADYLHDCNISWLGDTWEVVSEFLDLRSDEMSKIYDSEAIYLAKEINYFKEILMQPHIYKDYVFRHHYEHIAYANLDKIITGLENRLYQITSSQTKPELENNSETDLVAVSEIEPEDTDDNENTITDMDVLDSLVTSVPKREDSKNCFSVLDADLMNNSSSGIV
jgi:predicted metal-dependent HD superfamily phosphohydrolase